MGLFDGAFFDPTSAGGILSPNLMTPGGKFAGDWRSRFNELLQAGINGASRGSGLLSGPTYGVPQTLNYQPQNLPQSPQDMAFRGTEYELLPQPAPSLPPPTSVPTLKVADVGDTAIPPKAAPVMSQPAITNQPQEQQQMPGFLDRLAAAGDNLALAPSFIGGLAHAAQGMQTGKRIDSKLQMQSDFLGNQTPYWSNSIAQTMTPATVGGSPAGGINTAGLQASMGMPVQINPATGRDDNFIKSLGPVLGAQVESALNGDSKLDGRMLQKIQPLATRAEPGWTAQTYQQRLGAYKSFYGGGKDQETARALNQSAGHFAELIEKMNALPGSQMPILNWAKNTYDTQVAGKGNANNFLINAHAVAAELSRLFKQTNLSDTEIKKWEDGLSPNMSPEQQRGMVRTLHGLYQEAFDALEKKRQDGLGTALAAKSPPLIGAHTATNLEKIKQFGIGAASQPGTTSTGVKWSVVQ